MPLTNYRVIDCTTNEIVANAIPTHEAAYEIATMYTLDYPNSTFTVESYTQYTVKGLGRDPDLH
jgi:hypothetical protein